MVKKVAKKPTKKEAKKPIRGRGRPRKSPGTKKARAKKAGVRKIRAKATGPVRARVVGTSEFNILRDHVIQRIRLSDSHTIKQLAGGKTKCGPYIVLKAIEAVKHLFTGRSAIEIHDYILHTSWHRDWCYAALVTRPNANHPIIVYANVNEGVMYLIRPFGKDSGQIGLDELERMLDSRFKDMISTAEYYALYLAFQESIRQRKNALLYDNKHSLLRCENIQACVRKKREIGRKRNLSPGEKAKELQKWNEYYERKSVRFMEQYFKLLDNRDYDEALSFLKGGNTEKYFGKQRLDTFYRNTKSIIGHLQIFIDLYQFVYKLSDRYHHSL